MKDFIVRFGKSCLQSLSHSAFPPTQYFSLSLNLPFFTAILSNWCIVSLHFIFPRINTVSVALCLLVLYKRDAAQRQFLIMVL